MRRGIQITENGQILYVASAEDIIIEKLKWYESGGRITDRQWNDLLGVSQVQGNKLGNLPNCRTIGRLRTIVPGIRSADDPSY